MIPTKFPIQFMFFCFLCFVGQVHWAWAQEKQEIRIGDLVEFTYRGETLQGVVEHTDMPGKFMVRYTHPDDSQEGIRVRFLSLDEMKRLGRAEISPNNRRRPGGLPMGRGRMGFPPGTTLTPAPVLNPMRDWRMENSTTSFAARLKSIKGTVVVLENEESKTVTPNLSELCEADRAYVANWKQNNLARRTITENPDIPFSTKRLKLTGSGWDFKLGASSSFNYSLPKNTVRLSEPVGFGARPRGGRGPGGRFGFETEPERMLDYDFSHWILAPDGQRCFLIANSNFNQGCLIQGLNFVTGQLDFKEKIDGHGIGLSLDGKKVAFLQTSQIGTERGELIVKEIGEQGNVLKRYPVKAFMDDFGYAPKDGFFMNETILVTIGDRIVAMDLDRGTGYSTTAFPEGVTLQQAALSPNRKQIAMLSSGGIFLFDVSRGKSIGVIEFPQLSIGKIAFSEDGSRIVFCSRGGIQIYDLTTGKLDRELDSSGLAPNKTVAWPHPRFLLFDDNKLFDLELGMVVWNFRSEGSIFNPLFHVGGSAFLFNDGNSGITPIELSLDRIEKTVLDFVLDDAIVLQEGDDFALEMNLPFGQQETEKIRQHFEQQLGSRGITYNQNSQNVFSCSVITHARQTQEIDMSRKDDRKVSVSFIPTTSIIELEIDGEVKWQRIYENTLDGAVRGERGETPQQAADRICQPKPGTFSAVRFPTRFMLFPNGKEYLGESTITKNGVVDVQ